MGLANAQDCLHLEGSRQGLHIGTLAPTREIEDALRWMGRVYQDVVIAGVLQLGPSLRSLHSLAGIKLYSAVVLVMKACFSAQANSLLSSL